MGARPGPDELAAKRPFIGWSGQLLFRLLGLPRETCYISNVRKDFSSTHSTPTESEIHAVLEPLRDELAQTQANVIIALGSQALYALTGKTSIDLWRGSIIESTLLPGRKVAATWHPAVSARIYSHRYVIARDLKRFRRESAYPDIRRPDRSFLLNPTLDEALAFLDSLAEVVGVDIETINDVPSCIGISDHPSRAACFPIIGGRLSGTELVALFRALDRVFRARKVVGQNIQFDVSRLERWGFSIENIEGDTMLAHHLLWTELGRPTVRKSSKEKRGVDDMAGKHSLDFIVSIYCDNQPYYKDEADNAWNEPGLSQEERWTRYWTYNCKDACCTLEAWNGLSAELTRYGQLDYYRTCVNSLIRPIMHMQSTGLAVSLPTLNEVRRRMELETQLLQLRLDRALGFACNVRSTTDMRYLVYDLLQHRSRKSTKGGAASVDEDTILELAYKSPHADLFRLILDIRKRRTLVSGFLGLETDDDGRYHAAYLIHGTDSGRLSSRAIRKGPQLQNIPKAARKIFVAKPGHVLLSGDLKRAEAMYVGFDSGDPFLMELFSDVSKDIYLHAASDALSINLDNTLPYRDCFKHVVLASNYGLGPDKLIIVLRTVSDPPIYIEDVPIRGITSPRERARYLLEAYHARARGVRLWQKRITEEVSRERVLLDSFGRRRVFLGRLDSHTFGAAFSFRPQASIVGVANRALRLLYAAGESIVAQTHDEVLLEVPETELELHAALLELAMIHPLPVYDGRTVTVPVELKYGRSWGEMQLLPRAGVAPARTELGMDALKDGAHNDAITRREEAG